MHGVFVQVIVVFFAVAFSELVIILHNVVHLVPDIDYERKLDNAAAHTALPDEPDMAQVQAYVMAVNERVVRDEI